MVFDALHSVLHLYRSNRSQSFREREPDITHMESRVLDYFARHPGATLSDLVQHSGRDKAQLTRLIKNLRENGFLEAREDAADRRAVRLHLTEKGLVLQQDLRKSGQEVLERAVEGLSAEQRQQLVDLLAVLKGNLERER